MTEPIVTPASLIKTSRTRWAWHHRFPQSELTLVAGDGGLGKSTLLVSLAAQMTRGELVGEHHGRPATVWWLTGEETKNNVTNRLRAADADTDRVMFVEMMTAGATRGVVIPDDLDGLAQEAETDQPALIVLDALNDFLVGIDSHKDQSLRTALTPLRSWAELVGAAVIGVAHFNKGSGGPASHRISGSSGYRNKARSVFLFGKPDTEEDDGLRYLVHDKTNNGPSQPTLAYRLESRRVLTDDGESEDIGVVVLVGEADVSGEDITTRRRDSDESKTEREIAREWLLEALADDDPAVSWETRAETGGQLGWSERTLRRARTELRDRGLIESARNPDRGTYFWKLTEDGRNWLANRDQTSDGNGEVAIQPEPTPTGGLRPALELLGQAGLLGQPTVCHVCENNRNQGDELHWFRGHLMHSRCAPAQWRRNA